MKKIIKGKVWSGFIGEYKKPPIYIICQTRYYRGGRTTEETIFIDDIFREFLTKKVKITIESED